MILLRRVIGDALRARRQSQHRTLREVSTAANVSLGYLSEIERGQKEPSSELLASICDALGAQLSELLRDVSQTVEVAENLTMAPVPALAGQTRRDGTHRPTVPAITVPDIVIPGVEPDAVPVGSVPVGSVPAAAANAGALHGRSNPMRSADGPRDGARLPVPAAILVPATVGARAQERRLEDDGDVSVSVRQDSPLKATLRAKRNVRAQTDRSRDVVCAV
ncbi:MAG TPA: helix-turn-helix transcriptional regulator [Micromonosporaceae bacterium]|nr:helix-turn-helix transcriptional regulator [Micromonosporaceae bacterium]